MQDFTAGGLSAAPIRRSSTGDPKIDELVRQLVAASGCQKSCEYIEELVTTALKMGRDQTTVADLKLFNRSLKELRHAARVFAPRCGAFAPSRACDTPLGHRGLPPIPGACYPAHRCLPGRDLHPLQKRSKQ